MSLPTESMSETELFTTITPRRTQDLQVRLVLVNSRGFMLNTLLPGTEFKVPSNKVGSIITTDGFYRAGIRTSMTSNDSEASSD